MKGRRIEVGSIGPDQSMDFFIDRIDCNIILVIGVKVGSMMRGTYFCEHPNNYSKEPRYFRQLNILKSVTNNNEITLCGRRLPNGEILVFQLA